jgi:hypothetical protein
MFTTPIGLADIIHALFPRRACDERRPATAIEPPPSGTMIVRPCPTCGENTSQRVLQVNRSAVTFWCSGCAIPHDIAREEWEAGEGRAAQPFRFPPAGSATPRRGDGRSRPNATSTRRASLMSVAMVAASLTLPFMAPRTAHGWLRPVAVPAQAAATPESGRRAGDAGYFWGAQASGRASTAIGITAATAQSKRVAAVRGIPAAVVRQVLNGHGVAGRDGEPMVDIAAVNTELDQRFPAR